jgi:hypothetical protein
MEYSRLAWSKNQAAIAQLGKTYKVFYLCRVSACHEGRIDDLQSAETPRSFIANGVVVPNWAKLPVCCEGKGLTGISGVGKK